MRGVLVAEIDDAVVLHLDDLITRLSAYPVVERGRRRGGQRHVEAVRLHVAELTLSVGELNRPVLLRHLRVVPGGFGREESLEAVGVLGAAFALFRGERFRLGDVDVVVQIDVGQGCFPPFGFFCGVFTPAWL